MRSGTRPNHKLHHLHFKTSQSMLDQMSCWIKQGSFICVSAPWPRPAGGAGWKHPAPLLPEAFAAVQRGADVPDGQREDQRGVPEHARLPQAAQQRRSGLALGAQQAARPGAAAQEV